MIVVMRLIGPRESPRSVRYQWPRFRPSMDRPQERGAGEQLEQPEREGLTAHDRHRTSTAIATAHARDARGLERRARRRTKRNSGPEGGRRTVAASASRDGPLPGRVAVDQSGSRRPPGRERQHQEDHADQLEEPALDLVPEGGAPEEQRGRPPPSRRARAPSRPRRRSRPTPSACRATVYRRTRSLSVRRAAGSRLRRSLDGRLALLRRRRGDLRAGARTPIRRGRPRPRGGHGDRRGRPRTRRRHRHRRGRRGRGRTRAPPSSASTSRWGCSRSGTGSDRSSVSPAGPRSTSRSATGSVRRRDGELRPRALREVPDRAVRGGPRVAFRRHGWPTRRGPTGPTRTSRPDRELIEERRPPRDARARVRAGGTLARDASSTRGRSRRS